MSICDIKSSVKGSDHHKNDQLNRHRSNPADNRDVNASNLTGHSIIYGELVILG